MAAKLKVLRMSCPPRESWFELAAGITLGDDAQTLLLHATGCGRCSQILKEAVLALEGLDAKSASQNSDDAALTEMKRALGQHMAARHRRKPSRTHSIAAAGTVFAISAAWTWISYQRSQPPLATLARAYTANRTMDLRIPGAAYAPLRTQRGDAGTPNNMSPDLLDSQARIQRHGPAVQKDPKWLYAAGRAAVLTRQFDDAIQDLTAASDLGEKDADFWVDFATAYFERGLSRNAPIDFTKAVEYLSRALDQYPRNTVALFNRGIVYNQLYLYDPAIRDLEKCLKLEKDPNWSQEAHSRLESLRKQRSSLFEHDDTLLEDQFETALQTGLKDQQNTLHSLAAKLSRDSRDAWLAEALNVPLTPVNDRALSVLSALARLRWDLRSDAYTAMKDDLAWLEHARLPKTLDVWARFELLFRDSHAVDLARCAGGEDLIHTAGRSRYQWFAIQARLERSTCLAGDAELNSSEQMVRESIALADASRFDIAGVRAQGFLSSHDVNEGRYLEAFEIANTSLARIAGRGLPLRRAHQFYNDMMRSAERLQEWNTATASEVMAEAVAEKSGFVVQQVLELCKLGDFAFQLGKNNDAESYYRQALSRSASLPRNSPAYVYYNFARVGMLKAARDEAGLRQVATEMPLGGRNAFFEAPLWNALSEVNLANGHPESARDYARQAIAAAGPSNADPSMVDRLLFRRDHEIASSHLVRSEIDRRDINAALLSWQQYIARDSELTGGCKRSSNLAPLEPGAVAITIAPIDGRLAIWTRTASSFSFRWASATPAEYLRRVRKLRRLAMSPVNAISDISNAAAAVANVLFQDLPPHPAVRQLRIHARGEFASFPLQIVTDTRPVPGIEDAAFVSLPGICSDGVCAAAEPGGTVVAGSRIDPRFERTLPSLGDLEAETRDVARRLPNSQMFSGPAATPTVLTTRAALAGDFHFSGHAVRWRHGIGLVMNPDPGSPDSDAQAGIWTVHPDKPFCANLAFFSACSTGAYEDTGTLLPGDLAEAALAAGAHRVIVALWDVDSQATHEFVTRFYERFHNGASAAAASHSAARSVEALHNYSHPYFWAPFVVFETDTSGS